MLVDVEGEEAHVATPDGDDVATMILEREYWHINIFDLLFG